jgi:hypothetical protein
VTCGHAASCMCGASVELEREETVVICKRPKHSTFENDDLSMVLFRQRPVLPGGERFRQAEISRSLNRADLLDELKPVGSAITPTQRRLNA